MVSGSTPTSGAAGSLPQEQRRSAGSVQLRNLSTELFIAPLTRQLHGMHQYTLKTFVRALKPLQALHSKGW